MKKLWQRIAAMGVTTLLCVNVGQALAQQGGGPGGGGPGGGGPGGGGRPNFDPEQMRQRMMERYKEALDVKSDDEWKIISERITKVNEARRDVGFGGGMGFMGRRGGPGGPGGPGGDNAGQGQNNRRQRFGGEPSPEEEALAKAIESKSSNDELKAKMEAYRKARQAKEAKLHAAQDELKKILSVRQEAVALQMGLLN